MAKQNSMRKNLDVLKEKVVKFLPAKYGSDLGWEKEIEEAQKEIKSGKIKMLQSVDDLDKPLTQLFP